MNAKETGITDDITAAGNGNFLSLRPLVQVRLAIGDNIFFGPGKASLMELVDKTGSLQEACKEMGLSYSKGTRMIKNTEKELGIRLMERWAGGNGGGGSRLTVEGKSLLLSYRELCRRVQENAEQIYPECAAAVRDAD